MGCIKLSILDEQYRKSEIKVCSPQKELTFGFHPETAGSLLFTGMERDAESGLDYMSQRYYSSDDGTFRSRDRLFEKYFWMSPYAYCANNPVKYNDPTGMDYDPVIEEGVNGEKGTITINATYYASEENKDKLDAAIKQWNDQSGKYEYTTGKGENQKTYTVKFNLKAEYYANDSEAEAAYNNNKESGQANLAKTVEGFREKEDGYKTLGGSNGYDVLFLKDATNRTIVHEIGHTLGIYEGTHAMQSGGSSSKIVKGHVAAVLERAGIKHLNMIWTETNTFNDAKPKQNYDMFGRFKKVKK